MASDTQNVSLLNYALMDLSACNGVVENFNLLPSRGTIP